MLIHTRLTLNEGPGSPNGLGRKLHPGPVGTDSDLIEDYRVATGDGFVVVLHGAWGLLLGKSFFGLTRPDQV
jgi:hypothetical protein